MAFKISFSSSKYVYPLPVKEKPREKNETARDISQIGDAETYAKVALEVGAELHETKISLEAVKQKAKRKIEQLTEKVDETKLENQLSRIGNKTFDKGIFILLWTRMAS